MNFFPFSLSPLFLSLLLFPKSDKFHRSPPLFFNYSACLLITCAPKLRSSLNANRDSPRLLHQRQNACRSDGNATLLFDPRHCVIRNRRRKIRINESARRVLRGKQITFRQLAVLNLSVRPRESSRYRETMAAAHPADFSFCDYFAFRAKRANVLPAGCLLRRAVVQLKARRWEEWE